MHADIHRVILINSGAYTRICACTRTQRFDLVDSSEPITFMVIAVVVPITRGSLSSSTSRVEPLFFFSITVHTYTMNLYLLRTYPYMHTYIHIYYIN